MLNQLYFIILTLSLFDIIPRMHYFLLILSLNAVCILESITVILEICFLVICVCLQVLIGITSSGKPLSGFSSKELLPAECLSSLVGLLNENNVKTSVYIKAMVLLFNLGECNSMNSKNKFFVYTVILIYSTHIKIAWSSFYV